jgi:hypothetical protein
MASCSSGEWGEGDLEAEALQLVEGAPPEPFVAALFEVGA